MHPLAKSLIYIEFKSSSRIPDFESTVETASLDFAFLLRLAFLSPVTSPLTLLPKGRYTMQDLESRSVFKILTLNFRKFRKKLNESQKKSRTSTKNMKNSRNIQKLEQFCKRLKKYPKNCGNFAKNSVFRRKILKF